MHRQPGMPMQRLNSCRRGCHLPSFLCPRRRCYHHHHFSVVRSCHPNAKRLLILTTHHLPLDELIPQHGLRFLPHDEPSSRTTMIVSVLLPVLVMWRRDCLHLRRLYYHRYPSLRHHLPVAVLLQMYMFQHPVLEILHQCHLCLHPQGLFLLSAVLQMVTEEHWIRSMAPVLRSLLVLHIRPRCPRQEKTNHYCQHRPPFRQQVQ
mmetsp:Transcript_31331/g.75778  ORF Transcript_31331/g.75778 Transcript_31331/m.75778 type:complete len:205 (+) Transcript_31331:2388-3002(+)